jgi:hypothetical protein
MRNLYINLLSAGVFFLGLICAISVAVAADMAVGYSPAAAAAVCSPKSIPEAYVTPTGETAPAVVRVTDCPGGQTYTVLALVAKGERGLAIGQASLAPKGCLWVKKYSPHKGWVYADLGPLRVRGNFNKSISAASTIAGSVISLEVTPGACGKVGARIDGQRTMLQTILTEDKLIAWYFAQ